jgi:hypothetical protein
MQKKCVVLIPVYKETLDSDEFFSVKISLRHLKKFEVFFIGPEQLNLDYYKIHFPRIKYKSFSKDYFNNINSYNKLLTSEYFYHSFNLYDYMLILQTDAILLKNELQMWVDSGYDYIGAPWPNGYSLTLQTVKISIENGILCNTFVGNGGLSLRNINSCINLIQEFPDLAFNWQTSGHAEDLFFSFMATLSDFFRTPNFKVAAKFAHDIEPEYLSNFIDKKFPFGVHAWAKYDRKYWESQPGWPIISKDDGL